MDAPVLRQNRSITCCLVILVLVIFNKNSSRWWTHLKKKQQTGQSTTLINLSGLLGETKSTKCRQVKHTHKPQQ